MYTIEFYEKENGESDVWNFLEELRIKAPTNKDARIQFKQISFYIDLLAQNGTKLSENITKHLEKIFGNFVLVIIEYSTFLSEKSFCLAASF